MLRRYLPTAALAASVMVLPFVMNGAVAAPPAAPGKLCEDDNFFVIEYTARYPGATGSQDGLYERSVPTTGGCASSWAQGAGQLSTAAIVAQCRLGIEPRFGPYPIEVRFASTYVMQNRADCIAVMSGVANGEIDPGNAPLFPGGTR
ncbi:MAG: hypothetical protein H0T14_04840 [Nocardioidaceae bacterium]|nr:hypothetical protein [Nocardioidaceae bacterium]